MVAHFQGEILHIYFNDPYLILLHSYAWRLTMASSPVQEARGMWRGQLVLADLSEGSL
jgi:hypothetical protein